MPVSKIRIRNCKNCEAEYKLGVDSTLHKYCSVTCRSKWHYNRWKSSGGKRCPKKQQDYWLKHKYGITNEDRENILKSQDYKCAICDTDTPTGYNWHVDHCHTTNIVRGILCSKCNQALGMINEDINILDKMKEYILERCKNGMDNPEGGRVSSKDGESIKSKE